ncbi:MAG: hypothetical protein JKY67_15760 [Pseudomonadales bacterium]|nr:hypothetical protein [Pseudomonadales bacterium]
MEREIAVKVMRQLIEGRKALAAIENIANKMEDKKEFVDFMKVVFEALGGIEDGPMLVVTKEHSDLAAMFINE